MEMLQTCIQTWKSQSSWFFFLQRSMIKWVMDEWNEQQAPLSALFNSVFPYFQLFFHLFLLQMRLRPCWEPRPLLWPSRYLMSTRITSFWRGSRLVLTDTHLSMATMWKSENGSLKNWSAASYHPTKPTKATLEVAEWAFFKVLILRDFHARTSFLIQSQWSEK